MPATLITGTPGAAKTLFVVEHLHTKHRDRTIYTNINGLVDLSSEHFADIRALPDAHAWYDLPEGSLIVFDEAQHDFPPRNAAKERPRYISELFEHRHRGLDLIFITQDPALLDKDIIRVTDQHIHVFRLWGGARSMVSRWQSVNMTPQPSANKSNALKRIWRHPKKYYGWYRSASQHTIKSRLPYGKIAVLVASISVTVGGFWFVLDGLSHRQQEAPDQAGAPITRRPDPGPGCTHKFIRYASSPVFLDVETGHHVSLSRSDIVDAVICR